MIAADAGREIRLGDVTRALIRPIRPDDKDLVRAGFERLGPESRYRRFLTPMPKQTEYCEPPRRVSRSSSRTEPRVNR